MISSPPPFVKDLLNAPPRAGEGVHPWLFRVARQLHAHLPAGEIVNLLLNRLQGCGRQVSRREVEDAVKNSIADAWRPNQGATSKPTHSKWPAINKEQREAIVRIDDNEKHTEQIVDQLFPGNPLLCCAKSSQVFETRQRDHWRGELSSLALIVPSPMIAPTGLTQEGKESAHTLNNTGPRRFLICEFDTGTTDIHAALLIHLAGYAPLVCAVHSGGKSLHGWFFVHGQPEVRVRRFFRYAVTLGADPATWTRSQFVRMPDGTRENGQRQTIFFLSLKPMEATP